MRARDVGGVGRAQRLARRVIHDVAATLRPGDTELRVVERLERGLDAPEAWLRRRRLPPDAALALQGLLGWARQLSRSRALHAATRDRRRRGPLGAASLAAAAAGLALLPGAPPRLDPAALESGRDYEVRVLRDEWGVPHVLGASDPDVAFGLAWAHAEDDFDTIQLAALAARGQLAAELGPEAAPNDYLARLMRVREQAEAGWTRLAPETRALCEAWADGLNRYAARHPEEARARLFPVRGLDVVAGFVHKLPLFYGLDRALGALLEPGEAKPPPTRGSNAFAVAPGRSADGWTRLVINSHQPWEGPVAWYEAHLRSDTGWETAGGLFPGTPLVLHGHNRQLGWAHTVNEPDLIDVFELELDPDDPDRYRFDGEWRRLERGEAAIELRLFGPFTWTVRRELLWSVHGPVLHTPRGRFAVRVAGGEAALAVEQWYRMNRARSLEEWKAAMRMLAVPMFHTVYADAAGRIGYVYNARLPLREPGVDPGGVLPGDTSRALWSEVLPWDRLPRVESPASGFVQNANSTPFRTTRGRGNPEPGAEAAWAGIETHLTNRARRLLARLGDDPAVSRAELEAIKLDVTYAPGSAIARRIEELAAVEPPPERPRLRRALRVLRSWNRRAGRESRAAALALLSLSPDHRDRPFDGPLPELLDRVEAAAERLERDFGRIDVAWGEVLRVRRGREDRALDGGPDLLRAVYARDAPDGRRVGEAGDSYVLLVEWSPTGELRSHSVSVYGSAVARPRSRHYADQTPLFAAGRLKRLWLDEQEIRAHLEREYQPGAPAGGSRAEARGRPPG
jgi:penicillin amidase/acyl-homoserine-lactone acylase